MGSGGTVSGDGTNGLQEAPRCLLPSRTKCPLETSLPGGTSLLVIAGERSKGLNDGATRIA
jgi:hypothetical protein